MGGSNFFRHRSLLPTVLHNDVRLEFVTEKDIHETGIANTMDLPERMLPRIASRLGLHRISFGPYSHTQLQQILATRLEGIPAFDKQAVEFASRKVGYFPSVHLLHPSPAFLCSSICIEGVMANHSEV